MAIDIFDIGFRSEQFVVDMIINFHFLIIEPKMFPIDLHPSCLVGLPHPVGIHASKRSKFKCTLINSKGGLCLAQQTLIFEVVYQQLVA